MADNRVAYGLAKKHGIDTTGMSPKQVWDALKEKGISLGKDRESDKERMAKKFVDSAETREAANGISLKDEYIGKSVGAKTKNYDIQYGDKIVHLVEGTYLRNKQIIAGKGHKRKIDEIDGLVKTYGGNADKWVKVKGIGTVDNDGKSEDVEIHWYEEPSVGKVKLKFKKRQ